MRAKQIRNQPTSQMWVDYTESENYSEGGHAWPTDKKSSEGDMHPHRKMLHLPHGDRTLHWICWGVTMKHVLSNISHELMKKSVYMEAP